jgi:hypothetical protein
MYNVRILNESDIPMIIELYNLCLEWRSPFQSLSRWDFWTNHTHLEEKMSDGRTVIFGAFKNDELIALTMGEYWKELPIWFYGGMITKVRTLRFDVQENGLAELLVASVNYAEELGYYTFYFLVSERQDKYYTHNMLSDDKIKEIIDDYLVVYEDSIEGAAKSKWPAIQRIFDKRSTDNISGKWYVKCVIANNNRRKINKKEEGWMLSQNALN